jgi:hypothetical protein
MVNDKFNQALIQKIQNLLRPGALKWSYQFMDTPLKLSEMLSAPERKVSTGKTQSEKDVWLYLSHLTFNANYTYVQGATFKRSYIEIYHLNALVSSDPLVCKMHKKRFINRLSQTI